MLVRTINLGTRGAGSHMLLSWFHLPIIVIAAFKGSGARLRLTINTWVIKERLGATTQVLAASFCPAEFRKEEPGRA